MVCVSSDRAARRPQVPGRSAAESSADVSAGRGRPAHTPADAEEPPAPRSRAGSRPGSNSSAESRSPYLRRKHLLGLDRDDEPAAAGGGRRQNVRGASGQAMTQSVVADPVSAAADTPGMNRSESFTIYKHE